MAASRPCTWVDLVPTSGQTVMVSSTLVDPGVTLNVCLAPATLLALLTVQLPTTGIMDGQVVKFTSSAAITSLAATSENGIAVQRGISSLIAGGFMLFQYRLSNTKWYQFN